MYGRRLGPAARRTRAAVVGVFLAILVLASGTLAQSPSPSPDPSATSAPTPVATPDPAVVAAAAAKLADMAPTLDTDRLLLVELRKELPADRAEAEAYLANVEQLALSADPERLGVIVSRVRAATPVYLDWRGQQYASQAAAQAAYLQTGAGAFDATWKTLRDAILLTVANRIDTVLDVVDSMQGGQ